MALEKTSTAKPVVAVFGGTGHTGRFVIAELLRRGMTPIAVARSAEALAAAHFSTSEVICRQAAVDDARHPDDEVRKWRANDDRQCYHYAR